uniref:Uncharacterized protein n=1 Tax=Tectiviridae sp. TaxID=2831614 RepID=A0A8S5VXZ0_9VIRU|nr:MAG TPA: hypothetical protein [Tectiviridae sp.]
MNLIKSLEKQLAEGKNLVAENGDVFGAEKLQKVALKEYNALVKKKEIDPLEKSFKDFFYDSFEDYLTVEEVISFIKQPFEESEKNETAEPAETEN